MNIISQTEARAFMRAEYEEYQPETFEHFEVSITKGGQEERRNFATYAEACDFAFEHTDFVQESSTVHDLFSDYAEYRRTKKAANLDGAEIPNPWKGAKPYLVGHSCMPMPKGANWYN